MFKAFSFALFSVCWPSGLPFLTPFDPFEVATQVATRGYPIDSPWPSCDFFGMESFLDPRSDAAVMRSELSTCV